MAIWQLRRDTDTQWTRVNPVLAEGEQAFELNTGKFKIGDGETRWNELEYFIPEPAIVALIQATITSLPGGGATGPAGPAGPTGPIGLIGPTGPMGIAGPQGPIGLTGSAGIDGEIGPEGPEGPEGPQGIPGEDGTGGGSDQPVVLGGYGRPAGGSSLEPAGVNGPWRWDNAAELFLHDPIFVTWNEGDEIPSMVPFEDGTEIYLNVTEWSGSPRIVQDAPKIVYMRAGPAGSSEGEFTGFSSDPAVVMPSTSGGTMYLGARIVNPYPEPNEDKTYVMPPEVRDIDMTTLLGDLVLAPEYWGVAAWDETEIGKQGDLYINRQALNEDGAITGKVLELWGPKDDVYGWGAPQIVYGFSAQETHAFRNTQTFLPYPLDKANPAILLGAGLEPPFDYYGPSQAAFWFEDTEGAPVFHIQGHDSLGEVFDLTPGVGSEGPPGPPGTAEITVFEYLMPVAQTTAVIDHTLGRNPIAVQVFDAGQLCDEYSVVFTVEDEQVTIGFDVSVAALIRLI